MVQAANETSFRHTDPEDRLGYLWFGIGALLWLFAVGGRWDIPLAAWLFAIFLLRFTRTSAVLPAIGLVWIASVGAASFWMWQLAIPIVPKSFVGTMIYGTLFALPFALDRLLWRNLPLAGRLLLLPAVLASIEFITGVFSPFGTAYGLLATTQETNLPLLQIIAVTGPYFIGFLIGWLATTANLVWENAAAWPAVRRPVMIYAAVAVAVIAGGELRLILFAPQQGSVRVAGLSPSKEVLSAANTMLGRPMLGASAPVSKADLAAIDPAKLAPAYAVVWTELLANTHLAARAGAKIVLWSENAAPLKKDDIGKLLGVAARVAQQEHIYISVAANVLFVSDRTYLIAPSGKVVWVYDKSHPIPGMEEYAPGNGRPAEAQTPWAKIGNVICYDADFPAMMHVAVDIMLIPGGDWPEMGRVHTLQMASLRTIENGYSTFRQDYNGVSAAIDYQGRVLAMQDTTQPGPQILIADLPMRGVATIYRMTGDLFAWLSVVLTLLLIVLALRRRCAATV